MSLRFGDQNIGEFYHVFNRGNNKRPTFLDREDIDFFFKHMNMLNSTLPIAYVRSNYGCDFSSKKLVEIYAYAILENHFHMILKQLKPDGISRYMHKLGTAYTKYFNQKYRTTGALFQGKYKYVFIKENKLLEKICYVNANHKIHGATAPLLDVSGDLAIKENIRIFCIQEGLELFDSITHYRKMRDAVVKSICKSRRENSIDEREL